MNNHFTQNQFAKIAAGGATRAELEHLRDCRDCGTEMESFQKTLSQFRSAVRTRVDDRLAAYRPEISFSKTRDARVSKWNWALVAAAVVVAIVVPYLTNVSQIQPESSTPAITETDADALMNRVNLHLSRSLPAPMEPIMSLIPSGELLIKSGGVR
jgi:uncharacterized membrane protein YvbJ